MPLNLGDVTFSIGADDRALRASIRTLQQFSGTVDRAQSQATSATDRTVAALRRQEKASVDALNQTLRLSASYRQLAGGARHADQVKRAFDQLQRTMASGQLTALQYQRAIAQFRIATSTAARGFNELAAAQERAQRHGRGLLGGLANFGRASSALATGPLGGLSSRFAVLGGIMGSSGPIMASVAAGFAAVAASATLFAASMIKAGASMQQMNAQLETATGSKTTAANMFKDIEAIADRTGQKITDLAPAFAKFTIAANGTGLKMADVRDIFSGVSEAAAKLQLDSESTAGIFKALEQMMSKGTISAEELRGQLGDRLPGAFQIMARALNMTTRELEDFMKKGEIKSADALPKFIEEMRRTMHLGGQEVDTYVAAWNRLDNAWLKFNSRSNATIGTLDAATAGLNWFTEGLKNHERQAEETAQDIQTLRNWWAAFDRDVQASKAFEEYGAKAQKGFENAGQAFRVAFAEMKLNSVDTWNSILDTIFNAGKAIGVILASIPAALGKAMIDVLNGLVAAFDWVREQWFKLQKIWDPFSSDVFVPTTPWKNEYLTGVLEGQRELLKKIMDERHNFAGTTAEWYKMLDAQQKEFARGQASIRAGLEGIFAAGGAGIPYAGSGTKYELEPKKPEGPAELSAKEQRALERRLEAMKAINDQIERMREEIEALGGSEAGLEGLTDKFKREKEVEKYAKALRKAGVETQFIAEKTKELNALLERRDLLEKQREALLQFRDVIIQGFDAVGDSLLNVFQAGEDAAENFKNAVFEMLDDILDEIIRMTLLNPLKNWLFGTDLPTAADAGGIFNLIKGVFGKGQNVTGGATGSNDIPFANFLEPLRHVGGAGSSAANFSVQMSQSLSDMAAAIRMVESGSYGGNYSALGMVIPKTGDRAYGAYQMMGNNIPSWSQQALGTSMTGPEILGNKSAQDAIFAKIFGGYMQKYGSAGASQAWFGGPGSVGKGGAGTDPLGTSGTGYISKVDTALKNLNGSTEELDQTITGSTASVKEMGAASQDAWGGLRNLTSGTQDAWGGLRSLSQGFQNFGQSLSSGIGSALSSGGGWWQNLLSVFTGTVFPGGSVTSSLASGWTTRAHTGGIVGNNMGSLAHVNPGLFIGAPRYAAGGVVGDEVPIIAHKGERIIPKGGAANSNNAGSKGVVVNVHNYGGGQVRTEARDTKKGIELDVMIDRIVSEKLQTRSTASNNAMRKHFQATNRLKTR